MADLCEGGAGKAQHEKLVQWVVWKWDYYQYPVNIFCRLVGSDLSQVSRSTGCMARHPAHNLGLDLELGLWLGSVPGPGTQKKIDT